MALSGALIVILTMPACSLGGESDEASETASTDTATVSSGAPVVNTSIRTCDLVTPGEVGDALGVEVAALGTSTTEGRCEFSTVERQPLAGVQIDRGQTPESVRARIDASGDVVEQVEPASRPTTWSPARGILTSLHEDAFVQVVLPGSTIPSEERKERALALLERVVARLAVLVPDEDTDLAGRSYVDNLLAKVEDGEWTLGEGLVATLRLLAGELDAADVLRVPDLASFEATGIVAMAREYAAAGTDAAAVAEVERVLGRLLFTPSELDAMARPAPRTAGLPGRDPAPQRTAAGATRSLAGAGQVADDCDDFYGEYDVPDGVGACLLVHTQTTGGVTFRIYEPDLEGFDAGWDDAFVTPAVLLVREVVDETVEQTFLALGSLPDDMRIVLGAAERGRTPMVAAPAEGSCTVTVFTPAQVLSPSAFQQTLAHEFAHCFQTATFPAQQVEYAERRWREEGLAEYLGAVAYPETNAELPQVNILRATEVKTATVLSRAYENVVWFHYLRAALGSDDAILDLVREGPTAGTVEDQQAHLASQPDIEELHHEFVRATTDGSVRDLDGSTYAPATSLSSPKLDVTAGREVSATFRPFGVGRFVFTVPKGMAVNLTIVDGAESSVSARPFASPGEWFPVVSGDEFLAECEEDATFVLLASSASQDTTFRAEISEPEEYDCEECVVGEWRLEVPEPFASATAPFVGLPDVRSRSVEGDVHLSLFDDGSVEVEIERFREVLVFDEHELHSTSAGRASGEWRIEGGQLSAAYPDFSRMETTTRTTGVGFGGTQNVPPVHTLLSRPGPYTCDEERLVYANPDGPIVTYRRR